MLAFGPLELGAARFAIAAVPAAAFLIITRPALPRWSEAWRFFTGGLFFVALYTTLLNLGEQTVSAGPASFIINVNPIILGKGKPYFADTDHQFKLKLLDSNTLKSGVVTLRY